MRIEGSFTVAAPRERVFAEITNPALMAGCIPGCEAIEVVDAKTYRARILVEVGPIKARFNLVVEVTEETPPERVVSVTRGEEGTRASVISSNNELLLAPAETGGVEAGPVGFVYGALFIARPAAARADVAENDGLRLVLCHEFFKSVKIVGLPFAVGAFAVGAVPPHFKQGAVAGQQFG